MWGNFEWTPQESLTPASNYAIKISRDTPVDWSSQLAIRDRASVLSDSSTTPPPPGTSTTPPSSGITFSTLPTSSQTGETVTPASKAGLSTGKIAGIGVGTAIAGLALAVAAFFIRRFTRRRGKPVTADTESWAIGGKSELDSKALFWFESAREMDAKQEVQELHGDGIPGEVEATNDPFQPPAPQELHAHLHSSKVESGPKSVA